jgi:hypothetical protein
MIEFLLGVGVAIVGFVVLCRVVDWLYASELELKT